MVEDNGPGIDSSVESSGGLGQGWKITRQRLELLKKQWGVQLGVEIINSDVSKGMIVKFTIPTLIHTQWNFYTFGLKITKT